jgi:anthranilate synthase/aminodeoxychorismate synthase-like glutamine amidotransferase
MLLLLDNYDSFVHNLARYFRRLGQDTVVVRNDAIDARGVRAMQPAAVVISPGPCTPAESGCSVDVVRQLAGEIPMLGVCLGHQAIATAFGGKIVRAKTPMHGRTSEVHHTGQSIFAGLPSPLAACRYHSLVVEEATLPAALEITARTDDGTIMAIAHRQLPLVGVQFHPEAILTEHGYAILANFLKVAGIGVATPLPESDVTPLPTLLAAHDHAWPLPDSRPLTPDLRPRP